MALVITGGGMLNQLLNYLYRYLSGRCTLQDVEVWLLSNLQGILDSGDEKMTEVANQIDADLVELGENLIDEATLRERLESYIRACETVPITLSETEPTITDHATATVETFRDESVVPGLVEDHRVDMVFV